jgi:hypothetical protein
MSERATLKMLNKRPTIKQKLEVAYKDGLEDGKRDASYAAREEFNCSKAAAQRDILKAAAELGQANAKLTYAMSQMIEKKGW